MEAKDLMIEDWVVFHDSGYASDGTFWKKDRVCLIDSIDTYVRVKWYDEDGCEEEWPNVSVMHLSPIPLTSEILEKNGFVIKKKWAQIGNFGDSPLIMWHFEDDAVLRDFKHELEMHQNDTGKVHVRIPCEYVHELQHALRLCGIEKEIIL